MHISRRRHVDVHKRTISCGLMRTGEEEEVQNLDFLVDVTNE